MRLTIVLHYSALVLIGIGLCMFLPLGFSLYYGDSDTGAFCTSISITLLAGIGLFFGTRQHDSVTISRREALALVTLSWTMVSLFGALPYYFEGTFSGYLDCLFESVSGFTTTGASVMTSIETAPHGILLWRDFTQWLGGMGIIVLLVALFPLLGMGTAYLFEAESPGPEVQRLGTRMRDTSQFIWALYFGLTLIEVLLLITAGGLSFFDSLSHAFGTMATGGFSTKDASIGAYDSLSVNIILIVFMFMAGINFALYYTLWIRRTLHHFWQNAEFRLYAFILIGATVLIVLDLLANADYSTGSAIEEAAFHTTSIQTTTGFAISNFDTWPPFSRMALLLLMVIGASAGSTGGGTKVVRLIVLVKYTYRQLLLAFNPQAIVPLRLGGRVLSERLIARVIGFSLLYFGIIIVATLVMSAAGKSHGLDFTSSLTSVISAVSNVGPGLGLVGPAENYAFLSGIGKSTLIICMLVGRLELLTVLVLFAPMFWRWR